MGTSEPADEEDLPSFSLGLEFLTPEKKPKEKEKRISKARVIVSRKTINFQTPILLSQLENTPFRNDKLKEKLLRNTRQFQQRKSDNKRQRNCASRINCRFNQPTSGHSRRSLGNVQYLQLRESNSQEITGLVVNLYLSLNTFLIDRFFVFLTVFFFAKFLALHAGSITFTSNWTCSSFKSVARLSSRIKNCTPLLLRKKIFLNKFSFRKALVVCFLSIFSLMKRDNCVNLA